MSNPTDEPLPFTEKPGALFVAPLGSDMPDHTVKDGIFVMPWPASWVHVKLPGEPYRMTDPAECSAVQQPLPAEDVRVADVFEPVRMSEPVPETWIWYFGPHLKVWKDRFHVPFTTRMMIGWESSDSRSRVIARQVVIANTGYCGVEVATRLTLPEPRHRWWHRLTFWRHPEPAPTRYYPSFEVYTVGELRRVR